MGSNIKLLLNFVLLMQVYIPTCQYQVPGAYKNIHKIVLSNEGFAQFLEYDIQVPPLKEFTFCLWLKFNDFKNDQPLFSYKAKGNERLMGASITSDGRRFRLDLERRGGYTSWTGEVPLRLTPRIWTHLCLSWGGAEAGAWALYLDGSLTACQLDTRLQGYVIPSGGRIIVGYDKPETDSQVGIDAEIYGFNMILSSTFDLGQHIDENLYYNIFASTSPKIDNVKNNNPFKYVILGDLNTDSSIDFTTEAYFGHNNFTNNDGHRTSQFKLRTSHNVPNRQTFNLNKKDHLKKNWTNNEMLSRQTPKTEYIFDIKDEIVQQKSLEYFDEDLKQSMHVKLDKSPIWSIINKAGQHGNFKTPNSKSLIFSESTSQISEYETPPPVEIDSTNAPFMSVYETPPSEISTANINDNLDLIHKALLNVMKPPSVTLSELETPPPVIQDKKIYGHWTTSSFPEEVLKTLKTNIMKTKNPKTIPLAKYSDSYPYASETSESNINPDIYINKNRYIRDIEKGHRNIEIISDSPVLLHLFEVHPEKIMTINVEISNRGEAKYEDDPDEAQKKYSKIKNLLNYDLNHTKSNESNLPNLDNKTRTYEESEQFDSGLINHNYDTNDFERFIRSQEKKSDHLDKINKKERFLQDLIKVIDKQKNIQIITSPKSYIEGTYFNSNRWNPLHNGNITEIHSKKIINPNSDFSFRKPTYITNSDLIRNDEFGLESKSKLTSENIEQLRKHWINKDENIDKKIPNIYNIGLLSASQHRQNDPTINNLDLHRDYFYKHLSDIWNYKMGNKLIKEQITAAGASSIPTEFKKNIRLGNALNEKYIFYQHENNKENTFVNSDDRVPDINHYRSNLDGDSDNRTNPPPSLRLKQCLQKGSPNYELFILEDGTISKSFKTLSILRKKSIGLKLIELTHQECFLNRGAPLTNDPLTLISWTKTPVKIFGGGKLETANGICGEF